MDLQLEALDLVGRELVFIPEPDRSVDRGMQHDSARKWLIGVERGLVSLAQAIGDFLYNPVSC